MFEMIVVFSALTAPVPVPIHRPDEMTAPSAIMVVASPAGAGAAHAASPSSAATIASHSASSGPVATARLARAYQ